MPAKKLESVDDEVTEAQRIQAERQESRAKLREAINKKFGEGSSFLASTREYRSIPRISSGVFLLDYGLGGGWPRGRISLIWGPKSSSKTTLFLRMVADAQRRDLLTNEYLWNVENPEVNAVPMTCAWIDLEGAWDEQWARACGVNPDLVELLIADSQEAAIEMITSMVADASYDVIVCDSIAVMQPMEEQAKAMDKNAQSGKAAYNNARMFRTLQNLINQKMRDDPRRAPSVFFVNQERFKIGVMFGDPRTKPGGAAQDFYTSVEVMTWGNKIEYYDEQKLQPKFAEFNFKVEKNKTGAPKIFGSYKQALSDDPNGYHKIGQVIEAKEVMAMAEKLGVYGKTEDGKKFKIFDQEYDRKKDIWSDWFEDTQNFLELKKHLMKLLCPKQ